MQRQREIAYKLKIGDLLRANLIFEESENLNKKLRYIEIGNKNILRINIVANVIDKYESQGEKKFASITVDDGSGQLRARVFSDDIDKLQNIVEGDTVVIIGLLRYFNEELYVIPEIIRKQEPKYLLVRKLEIDKSFTFVPSKEEKKLVLALRDEIINMIKDSESNEGIEKEDMIMKISSNPELINEEIKKLLEEGLIYEPKPGRVRYLG